MTSRPTYGLLCDGCGAGFADPQTPRKVGEVRAAAAKLGWTKTRDRNRGQGKRGIPPTRDWCPNCRLRSVR